MSPPRRSRVAQQRRVDERLARPARRGGPPSAKKSQSTTAAAEDQPDHRRQPEPSGRVGLRAGRSPTCPSAGRRTRRARGPSADSTVPTRSSFDVAARPACRRSAASAARMTMTITTSPANTQRHEKYVVKKPADERAGGHGDRAGRRDQPVGARAARSRAKFDATSATIAGRISAAPSPSRNDQPSISTGEVRRERGGERAAAVDHAADRERPLAADDLRRSCRR